MVAISRARWRQARPRDQLFDPGHSKPGQRRAPQVAGAVEPVVKFALCQVNVCLTSGGRVQESRGYYGNRAPLLHPLIE
jgi:hypothetical protein